MRRFFLFCLLIFLSYSSVAQKAKHHIEIIFRLSRYVTWPAEKERNKFVIGVVGDASDFKCFQLLAAEKEAIHNFPIEVRYYECAETMDDCNLLYVSEACKIEMSEIIMKTKDEPILIVSGKAGYGKLGSIINFVDYDGKLTIELNQNQADKRGLRVSDKLKNLATVI
ncbi:MAG: YfiR family protein [Cytophagales bacterium]|nr:YfiR family protein [Cytophagales bacterium]